MTDPNVYPPGWNRKRVESIIRHYENQTDEEAVAEDEWCFARDEGRLKVSWAAYDPTWLVRLAQLREPDQPWLAEALANCTRVFGGGHGDDCLYFADPWLPKQPGSEWQFETNIMLESDPEICSDDRDVILDILVGQKVGGLEFFS